MVRSATTIELKICVLKQKCFVQNARIENLTPPGQVICKPLQNAQRNRKATATHGKKNRHAHPPAVRSGKRRYERRTCTHTPPHTQRAMMRYEQRSAHSNLTDSNNNNNNSNNNNSIIINNTSSMTAASGRSKRRLEYSPNDHDDETDVVLGSSLKKVRISLTPGELRLDRDLAGLTVVSDRTWLLRPDDVWLDRLNDPLQLLLRMGETARVYIQLSRMYPHVPPTVARVENPFGTIRAVRVMMANPGIQQQQMNQSDEHGQQHQPQQQQNQPWFEINDQNETVLVYHRWSPIMWIGDLLRFLVEAFDHDRQHPQPQRQSIGTTPQQQYQEQQQIRHRQQHEPSKHQTLFAPNRFDLGYDRSSVETSTRPMEC